MSEQHAPNGQLCWLEIPVTDAARARAFYSAALGWTGPAEPSPSPIAGIKENYFFSCGTTHGSFVVMERGDIAFAADEGDKARLGVLATFMCGGIEETLDTIVKAGGKVHVPKTRISPEMGYFARFIDSEGNLLGIFSPK